MDDKIKYQESIKIFNKTMFLNVIAVLLMDIMVLDNKEIEKKVFKPVIMKFLMVFNFLKTGCSLNNIYNIK